MYMSSLDDSQQKYQNLDHKMQHLIHHFLTSKNWSHYILGQTKKGFKGKLSDSLGPEL